VSVLLLERRRIATAVAGALLVVATATAGEAHAGGPSDDRRALPAPFALPDLSHPRFDASISWTVGRLSPEASDRPGVIGAIVRPALEAGLLPRRLFVGATYPFMAGLPPDGGLAPGEIGRPAGTRTLFGNVEGHVRAVFPIPSAMEIGFVLAVVVPTATFERNRRPNRSVIDAVASFDPTSYVHFLAERVALRPAGDLRIVRGPVVVQGRHGIDLVFDTSGTDRVRASGRLIGHLGFLLRPDIEASVEATQSYFFSAADEVAAGGGPEAAFAERYRIRDGRRSALTFSPGIRFSLREVDVGAAIITNLRDPLSPVTSGFIALSLSVIGHVRAERSGFPSTPIPGFGALK
jgi:hypothetical protein